MKSIRDKKQDGTLSILEFDKLVENLENHKNHILIITTYSPRVLVQFDNNDKTKIKLIFTFK